MIVITPNYSEPHMGSADGCSTITLVLEQLAQEPSDKISANRDVRQRALDSLSEDKNASAAFPVPVGGNTSTYGHMRGHQDPVVLCREGKCLNEPFTSGDIIVAPESVECIFILVRNSNEFPIASEMDNMNKKKLNQLPTETIKLLASTQIITSVSTAVKELVENSIDADSRNIQVKMDNYGFDVLEVKDDGYGISSENVQRMFLPGYTSKISCFNDLGKLESYGFRGEALSALAKLSRVSITTRTSSDNLAMSYVINSDGIPESSKPSHLTKGTIVTASNLFGNLPVRKQYLSSKKRVSEELKKVEHVVQSLSIIHPELRITLIHNKCPVWQKNSVKGLKQSFMQVVGLKIVSRMEHLNELKNNILVDLILPRKNLDNIENIFTSSNQSLYLYVNRRPVACTSLSKVVMEYLHLHFSHLNPTGKYAVCLISVEVPPQEVDVNLEPNKTKVLLKNELEVTHLIDFMLSSYYNITISRPDVDDRKSEICDKEGDDDGDLEEDELEEERQNRKRPRLEDDIGVEAFDTREEELNKKSDDLTVETVSEMANNEPLPKVQSALSLCSQINKDNCTPMTDEQLEEFTRLMNKNGGKLITSGSWISRETPSYREDIQNHDWMKKIPKENSDAQHSKMVELPEWPTREKTNPTNPTLEKLTEDSSKTSENTNIDAENDKTAIDVADWSKGVVNGTSGKVPSGVVLARPPSDEERPEVPKYELEDFDLSMRSVSSQLGRKEFSAFTKFARIMRPKILAEIPGLMFTKVAGLLADRWKALPANEKKQYEKLSKVVDDARKEHLESKSSSSSLPFICKKKESKKPERFKLEIAISFEEVLRRRKIVETPFQENEIQVIGQLQPSGNWLYKKGTEIGHVRHLGLHELILSQRMLSSYSVPRKQTTIHLDESVLGKELWDVLLNLDKEYDPLTCTFTVVSDVISKNGFKIDLEKDSNGFRSGCVREVASMIPFYGISELKETLNLYLSKGEFADLGSLRPTAVINYITNEAVRIARRNPRPPDLNDLKEWIGTWQLCLSNVVPQCLHHRDIFVPFYQMNRNCPS